MCVCAMLTQQTDILTNMYQCACWLHVISECHGIRASGKLFQPPDNLNCRGAYSMFNYNYMAPYIRIYRSHPEPIYLSSTSFLLTPQLEKWQPEEKNHDLAPELAAYAVTQSFSHASYHCGHDSSPPIAIYTVHTVPAR